MAAGKENEMTFASLLEEDKERLTSQIGADRSVGNTSKVLENEVDRLLLRYSQTPAAETKLVAARQMMQTVKSSLPVVESVTDVEVWQKESGDSPSKMSLPSLLTLTAGAGFVIVPALLHTVSLLVTLAGVVCTAAGAYFLGRGRRKALAKSAADNLDSTRVFLVDADLVYHLMKRMIMTVDHSLESLPALEQTFRKDDPVVPESQIEGGLSAGDIDFFAELLETAYTSARQNPGCRTEAELIENIRYYLHSKGIDLEDFDDKAKPGFFEMLPSGGKSLTIRPALVCHGRIVKKGIASEGSD